MIARDLHVEKNSPSHCLNNLPPPGSTKFSISLKLIFIPNF